MRLLLRDELPFTEVSLHVGDAVTVIENVLVDTGSARSVFATDAVARVGLAPGPDDVIRAIRGVGGREFVFSRRVDRLTLGPISVERFKIQIAGMDYDFAIDGILGMDFLRATGAVLDLDALTIRFPHHDGE